MKNLILILCLALSISLNGQIISGVNTDGDSVTVNLSGIPVLVASGGSKTILYRDVTTKHTLNGSLASTTAKSPDFFTVTPTVTRGVYRRNANVSINRNEIESVIRLVPGDTLPGKCYIVMKNNYFNVPVNEYYIDVMANVDAPKSFAAAYTPTFNATTNVDSLKIIGSTFSYVRTGDWVDVVGEVRVWTTNDSTVTAGGISLPFASAITATTQLSGVAYQQGNWQTYGGGYVNGHIAGDRAQLNFYALSAGSTLFTVNFRYKILR